MDYDPKGFRWVTINDNGKNLFGIERYDKTQKKNVIAIFNFSNSRQTYRLHPEKSGALVPIINTDWERFGGRTKELPAEAALLRADSVSGVEIKLAPFGSILYEIK